MYVHLFSLSFYLFEAQMTTQYGVYFSQNSNNYTGESMAGDNNKVKAWVQHLKSFKFHAHASTVQWRLFSLNHTDIYDWNDDMDANGRGELLFQS